MLTPLRGRIGTARFFNTHENHLSAPLCAVLLAYLLITLVVTYPLVLEFGSHNAGGNADENVFMWNFWWMKHALLDLKTNPLYTDHVYFPQGAGLSLHAFHPLLGLLSLPLQGFLSLVSIFNLFVVLSFVLSGYGAFLLAGYCVGDRRAAFMAGVIFSFSSCHLSLVSFLNVGSVQWLPFSLLFLLRTLDQERSFLRDAAAAGFFAALTFLTGFTNFIFLALVSALLIPYHVFFIGKRPADAAKRLLLIGLIAAPLVFPLAFYTARDMMSGEMGTIIFWEQAQRSYHLDLLSMVTPDPTHPLLGWLSPPKKEAYGFLGYIPLALAVTGAVRNWRTDKRVPLWVFAFAVFTVLSLGHQLHVFDRRLPIPLPFQYLSSLPVFDHLRSPSRFNVLSVLAVSLLAASALRPLIVRRGRAVFLLVPLLLFETLRFPYPTNRIEMPGVYREIGRDAEAQVVLEVPFFASDGLVDLGPTYPGSMLYQTTHGKKIFNGYFSRTTVGTIFSYLNLPVIRSLLLAQKGLMPPAETLAADKGLAGEFVNLFHVDYVVVHKDRAGKSEALLKTLLPMKKFYEDHRFVAYRTTGAAPRERVTVDAGEETSIPYLMRGWANGQREEGTSFAWTYGTESVLLLNLDETSAYRMTLRLRPHHRLRERTMSVSLNGRLVGSLSLPPDWSAQEVLLPRELTRHGLNRVVLKTSSSVDAQRGVIRAWSPGSLLQYTRAIPAPDIVLAWEQDNEKLMGGPIAVAIDSIAVEKLAGASVPRD
jgi:hypothetical protein